MITIGVARIFDWGGAQTFKKVFTVRFRALIGGCPKCSWSSISDRRGANTTYIVNDLNIKRSLRIEKGPILFQNLGEDQKKKEKDLHDTNLSLLALRLGKGAGSLPRPPPPPGYAYDDYFVLRGIPSSLGHSSDPTFLWISYSLNLLLVLSHQAEIKSFIILAVLRRNELRVYRAHLRVIAPAGNTAPFEEMLQGWRTVGNTVFNLTDPRFEPDLRSNNWLIPSRVNNCTAKRLIQARDIVARMLIELRSCDRGRRENNAFSSSPRSLFF